MKTRCFVCKCKLKEVQHEVNISFGTDGEASTQYLCESCAILFDKITERLEEMKNDKD